MHDHQIGEPVWSLLINAPIQKPRQDDRMAEAANRKKLGHALQHGHDNRLQCSQGGPRRSMEMTPGGRFMKIPWQSAWPSAGGVAAFVDRVDFVLELIVTDRADDDVLADDESGRTVDLESVGELHDLAQA